VSYQLPTCRPRLRRPHLPTPSAAAPLTPNGRATYIYVAGLAGVLALLGFGLVVRGETFSPLWAGILLGALAAVAERAGVRLSGRLEISISLLPRLFAAVVFGPLPAMLVGAVSMLGDFRPPYARWAVYTCTRSISGGVAGLVAGGAADLTSNLAGSILLATAAAAAAGELLDLLFCLITLKVRRTDQAADVLRDLLPVTPTAIILYSGVVSCLAYAYVEVSPWSVFFFLLPGVAAQRLFVMYQAQRQLAGDLATVNQRLERANLSFASALVATLDARDRYTAGHSAIVADYARSVARIMGLTEKEQQLAHLAGLVHDVGKIGVATSILDKPGPLTLEERRRMEEHSAIGERILIKVEAYGEIATIVRHHHERVDGFGYPDGLVAEEIPLISRIICAADAYNAMTSDRPYRDAMPDSVARRRLLEASGSQFDADVIDAFLETLGAEPEAFHIPTLADDAIGRAADLGFSELPQSAAA
jgi:HD-GYP domain-containing protein (c-di-GMP phosphodiesterase class II)